MASISYSIKLSSNACLANVIMSTSEFVLSMLDSEYINPSFRVIITTSSMLSSFEYSSSKD